MFSKISLLGLVIVIAYFWQTKIKQGPVYQSDKSLDGKTVIITGGNAGIGKHTCMELAKRNAKLIIASRNVKKSELVKKEIFEKTNNKQIKVMKLDLEDFDSVRKFAEEIIKSEEYVDYLVNNAGALFLNGLTKHGYGRIFTINHLGHFLLTNLLLDKMKQQSDKRPVRIINLSSTAYMFGDLDFDNLHTDPKGFVTHFTVYSTTKLANVYFTSELDRRLRNENLHPQITTYSVHPGVIESELGQHVPWYYHPLLYVLFRPFSRSGYYGAQTTMFTLLDDEIVDLSGGYFSDCQHEQLFSHATNITVGEKLWEASQKLVGLQLD